MIKAIVFDCFGVLTTDTWLEFIESLPGGVDITATRAAHRDYAAGRITKQESAKRIHEITGRDFVELEDAISAEITKNMKLFDYIKTLKKDYKIGLLSNVGNNWIRDYFLTPEEQSLFDSMVFSFEVGMVKPEPSIFKLICDQLGVKPEEAILVDDKESYCSASRSIGMEAIWYQNFDQFKKELKQILSIS